MKIFRSIILIGAFAVSAFGAAGLSGGAGISGQSGLSGTGGGNNFATSLAAHWKFNEASGTAADSSGNGNTLANNNTATFTAGKLANAATLVAASSQSFSIASNATIATGDIDFTVTCWVKLTDKSSAHCAVQKSWDDAYGEWIIYYSSGRDAFVFSMANGAVDLTETAVGSPTAGTYYFIVASYNAATDTASISVNNNTATTGIFAGGNAVTTGTLKVGVNGAAFMNGQVDDVGYWKRILTAGEITSLYNGGAGLDF